MPQRTVDTRAQLEPAASTVWSALKGFDLGWHPGVDSCALRRAPNGTRVRDFTDLDGRQYVEERTYVSDTDRVLCYRLTSGIEGILSYAARVDVSEGENGGSTIRWRADISADAARLAPIAEGTHAVFEQGFAALDALPDTSQTPAPAPKLGAKAERVTFGSNPKLSCLHAGLAGSDILVLFLHGIGGQASNWDQQLAAVGTSCTSAALDLRGYGDSTLGDAPTEIEDHCADILATAKHFKAKKLVLVGLSFGSWIATSFAMRHPEKLAGLVLAGGCTGMSEAGRKEREAFHSARMVPLNEGKRPADFAQGVLDLIAGPEARDEVRQTLFDSMAAIPAETYKDALDCFCNPNERFDFRRIACPVLLMTGSEDRLAPSDEIRKVSNRILEAAHSQSRDVRFEVIEGAGHVCNLEQSDVFNSHLARFLKRLPGVTRNDKPNASERRQIKRDRILAAAHQEFCNNGFDGASMDRLAEAAGVSKPTLYQYFGNKEAIFTEVLEMGRAHLVAPLAARHGSLVDRLWDFSWTYADFVLRPDMLSLARLILGEAGRRPDSAKAYHQAGPERAFAGIVDFVTDCVESGELVTDTPDLAANDLWSLILSGPRDYYLHHVNETPDPAYLLSSITHGLKVFLAVYSKSPDRDLRALDQKLSERRPALQQEELIDE